MSELLKERVLVILALLLCVATVLLAVWEAPDMLPKATVYTEPSAGTMQTAAPTQSILAPSGLSLEVPSAVSAAPSGTSAPAALQGRLNINAATREELTTLPGIGDALAGRIIDYRETHGGFASVEEIQNVSGIGEKRFAAIRDLITVG